MSAELSAEAVTWLVEGEHGISSEAIFQCLLFGRKDAGRWLRDHPSDPDDFRRCELLLRQVPELRPRLGEMAEHSPVWAGLVARWAEIDAAIEVECPGYLDSGRGWARGAYALMDSIIRPLR